MEKSLEPPIALISSTRSDFAPRYSPDGKRIAFESARGGNLEIWTCNSAGEECMQLTSSGADYTGLPTWSPDGKELALYSRVHEKSQIFVVGADGTGLRQVTSAMPITSSPRGPGMALDLFLLDFRRLDSALEDSTRRRHASASQS